MLIVAITFVVGLLLGVLLHNYFRKLDLKQAQLVGEELIENAQETFDELMDQAKERALDFENELISENEKQFEKIEERILSLSNTVDQNRKDVDRLKDRLKSKYKRAKSKVDRVKKGLRDRQNRYSENKDNIVELKTKLRQSISEKHELSLEEVQKGLETKLIDEEKTHWTQWLEQEDQELLTRAEKKAKKVISIVLNRFIRPYCSERGLGFIQIPSEKVAKKVLASEHAHLKAVEKVCGVDVILNETAMTLSVSGFDPVRRELGRSVLEKMLSAQQVDEAWVERTFEKTKKDLFKKILKDGNQICNELKLKNVSTEVRKMMGALRYRYSFTQNQYFHCAEVGHLCGLIAAELGEDVGSAKRAGMLHDLGKAMDHSIDGGHAVIGADFIEKNGEKPHIVHAVRAHHYDEPPDTPLAFTVIGGDALSGARPGARRSTASTYMQKMDQLQEIGNSFDGVIDTFILSAGREVRVEVDSRAISDTEALDLSHKIADRVETECNYPGTIKITVVRKTQAVDMAK